MYAAVRRIRLPGIANMHKQKEQKLSVWMGKSTVTIFIEKYHFDPKRNVLKPTEHFNCNKYPQETVKL